MKNKLSQMIDITFVFSSLVVVMLIICRTILASISAFDCCLTEEELALIMSLSRFCFIWLVFFSSVLAVLLFLRRIKNER